MSEVKYYQNEIVFSLKPPVDLEARRILVIAAHPDDELLGCGGTVALHCKNGDRVWSLIACEGSSHRNVDQISDVHGTHYAEQAGQVLGVERVIMLNFPDQKLDTFTLCDIMAPIEKVVQELNPHVVYCQYGGDINYDHEVLFKALSVAVRPTSECFEAVFAFDTASSTEWAYPRSFVPDTWVDISRTLEQKLEAFKCYDSELRDYPHPRSVEGLKYKAHAWGNQCCMDAAEVFMTVRKTTRNGKTPF